MINKDVSQLLCKINKMNPRQQSSVLNILTHLSNHSQIIECIKSHSDADGKCPSVVMPIITDMALPMD